MRTIKIVVVSIASFVISGCGGSDSESSNSSQTEIGEVVNTVLTSLGDMSQPGDADASTDVVIESGDPDELLPAQEVNDSADGFDNESDVSIEPSDESESSSNTTETGSESEVTNETPAEGDQSSESGHVNDNSMSEDEAEEDNSSDNTHHEDTNQDASEQQAQDDQQGDIEPIELSDNAKQETENLTKARVMDAYVGNTSKAVLDPSDLPYLLDHIFPGLIDPAMADISVAEIDYQSTANDDLGVEDIGEESDIGFGTACDIAGSFTSDLNIWRGTMTLSFDGCQDDAYSIYNAGWTVGRVIESDSDQVSYGNAEASVTGIRSIIDITLSGIDFIEMKYDTLTNYEVAPDMLRQTTKMSTFKRDGVQVLADIAQYRMTIDGNNDSMQVSGRIFHSVLGEIEVETISNLLAIYNEETRLGDVNAGELLIRGSEVGDSIELVITGLGSASINFFHSNGNVDAYTLTW